MTTVRSFLEEVKALEQYGHDCCARIDDKIRECCERIKDAYSNDVMAYQTALSRMEQQEILTTYDVLDNERHKTVCELRKSDFTLYTPEQFVETLYKMLYMTGGTPTNICVTQKAVRDKLIHLLGGDLKEDSDGVDAGRCDEADSDCPDAPAAERTGDCVGHLDVQGLAPITTELRDYMETYKPIETETSMEVARIGTLGYQGVIERCDAIDAIHAQLEHDYQVACDVNERQDMQYAQLKAERDSLAAALNRDDGKHPAWAPESHYMMLPKDADGERVHIGDVMEWPDGETFEVVGIGDGTLFYADGDWDALAEWTSASTKHHYHAPTVEDVLREFVSEFNRDDTELCDEEIIERFAAKLRLAGDADE